MPKTRDYVTEVKMKMQTVRDLLHFVHGAEATLGDIPFFQKLSEVIQDVEAESTLASSKKYKKACDLIHHLLYTPWGAPFVTERSLLESAQTYKFQNHFESDLYLFIKRFLDHSEESESQIFKSIELIINDLGEQ